MKNIIQIGTNRAYDELSNLILKNQGKLSDEFDINQLEKLILIEPLNFHNKNINKCYKDINCKVIDNIAVTDDSSINEINFYYHLNDGDMELEPHRSFEIASASKSHLIKHGKLDDSNMIQVKVPATTINSLFEKHNLTDIDLLFIDAEGFDGKILLDIDFNKFKIKYIVFEFTHEDKITEVRKHLFENNFNLITEFSPGNNLWKNMNIVDGKMKIFSNFIPQDRFEKRLGNIKRFKDKPISIFNDKPATPSELAINPINILLINEPNEFFGLHDYAKKWGHLYSAVLSWNSDINLPNSEIFPHGERNLDLEYCNSFGDMNEHLNYERVFEVNFLRGALNKIEGHHLRHRIFDKEPEIKIPHKWYPYLSDFNHEKNNRPDGNDLPNGNPIEGEGKKELWNRNAMFHVAVENSKHNNYFTDKIIDCFCTKTVPIYWGAPYIGDFYDDRGIIHFKDEFELVDIINNLTPQDYYDMQGFIDVNYQKALKNSDFFKRIEEWVDELIKINNL